MVKCKYIKDRSIKKDGKERGQKLKQEIKKIVEKMAIKAAKMQVDSTCKWVTYQPKETEAIKKLRKR